MSGLISLEDLKAQVSAGRVDTVLACLVDMQGGRLMGKRFHAAHFVASAWEETHCCNYLLATDLEMGTPEGYASTSWERGGYGDYVMRPDLQTLRPPVPWLEGGTVMVLCDVLDHHTHAEVAISPRAILKRQVARLADMGGFTAMTATELEFFLFEKSFDEIRKEGFRDLTPPISGYNEDYHILQTTKEEHVMRPIRNHLYAAGIPVENSKGEAETGQEELNIRYAPPAMDTAAFHTIAKHAVKEIAWAQGGHAATFLPKWHHDKVGSSSHVHQSLWKDGGANAFHDSSDALGMSDLMKSYMAGGLLKYAPDYTAFMAPYVNSYKRFMKGTFAPTRIIWSVDNRTAGGFRLCGGDGTKAIRVECRIPGGSDMNPPYLAMAGMLAAGIAGIEEGLTLQPPTTGDVYQGDSGMIPGDLQAARDALHGSTMLRAAIGGDEVVDHYTHAAEVELEEFARVVTDWEIARGFERA